MRICFIGHKFHQLSRSHIFFLEVLRKIGSVEEYYHSPDDPEERHLDDIMALITANMFDRYVFWQTEYIASELLGKIDVGRIILVPMLDAAHYRSEAWWQRFQMHRFVSFSRTLHETLQRAGLDSAYFQYFPPPAEERIAFPEPDGAFFWERRPMEQLNAGQVHGQCSALGLNKLHIHAAPDRRRDKVSQFARLKQLQSGGITVSISNWFDDRSDLDSCAGAYQFYFAPRLQEGIGTSFLEAMARGQIVIAPDAPTMNEYVGHLSSGILYNQASPNDLPALSKSDIQRIGNGAFERTRLGHARWIKDLDRLNSIIVDDGRRWSYTDFAASYRNLLRREAHKKLHSAKVHQ